MTRLAAMVLSALVALAAAASALAYSPPLYPDGTILGLRVNAAPDGTAFVTWPRKNATPGAAALGTDGNWTWADPAAEPQVPPAGIPEPTAGLAVAADAAGNAVAVWRNGDAVRVASRPAGGPFGAAQTVAAEPTDGPAELAVAVGAGGHAVALWTVRSRDESNPVPYLESRTIRAADRAPDGTWSAPYDLEPATDPVLVRLCAGCPDTASPPAVTVDPAGNAAAAWAGRAGPEAAGIVWADRPAGGAWAAPRLLAAPAGSRIELTVDASRTTVASWEEGGELHVARRYAGEPFFSFFHHLGPVNWGMAHSLTADARGGLLAVWVSGWRVLASKSQSGSSWSEPVDLTQLTKPVPPPPPPPPVFEEKPAVRPPLLEAVRLSRATLRRPVPTVLSFRLGTAGEVRVTVQRRGRGKAVRGLRVAAGAGDHRIRLFASRPLPPGRYTVRVRVTVDGQAPVTGATRLVVLPAA